MGTIPRTAVPIWSPASLASSPLLATGTVSGALDASFSSDALLELWDPFAPAFLASSSPSAGGGGDPEPLASWPVQSRFNRLAWGGVGDRRKRGVIAAGLESGEIVLWDPDALLNKTEKLDPVIARYDLHKGPVRGLDFNPHQTNLLASGATNGELYIWDLQTPNKPFSPGPRSRSLDDITTLAWNAHVPHILASGSNSGYTVVWDLKAKREVTALSYSLAGGPGVASGWGAGGGKRGVGALGWHPDTPTKLVTASDDDQNPIIMLWDLRNWKEPEKILAGHEKGILSLSWCKQDSSLLLSSGKDGRTLCWNPGTGEIVAEVTPSSNWTFDVQWCPSNPSILSTASLSGAISLLPIQSTRPSFPSPLDAAATAATAEPADDFAAAISANAANYPTQSLSQHPKWLNRPSSVSFGFGGKLVVVSKDGVVVRTVVGEPSVVASALGLENALASSRAGGGEEGALKAFCETRARDSVEEEEAESWKLLETLFASSPAASSDSSSKRAELVTLLGFSKEETRARVEDALRALARKKLVPDLDEEVGAGSEDGEAAAAGAKGDGSESTDDAGATTTTTTKDGGGESEVTEPSLFGDDGTTPATDFFAQIGAGRGGALPEHVFGGGGANSSVAATVASSEESDVRPKSLSLGGGGGGGGGGRFRIYPEDGVDGGGDVDRLLTRALVMGDFEAAVQLALSVDRYADALLLALQGGPALLDRTRQAYLDKQASARPYLRVLQAVVGDDLADVVRNAELDDWKEVFVVLCTFAPAAAAAPAEDDVFGELMGVLGSRLEAAYEETGERETRKNAMLCYVAAGMLEKVVGVWVRMMDEEEAAKDGRAGGTAEPSATQKYEARASALQAFVEKVAVFQHAVGYVDVDLAAPPPPPDGGGGGGPTRTYKLAQLYDRYVEYAELLAAQGLVSVALKYIAQTPADFEGATDPAAPALTRHRLEKATGRSSAAFASSVVSQTTVPVASTSKVPARSAGGYQYPTQDQYVAKYGGGDAQAAYVPPGTTSAYAPSRPTNNHDDPYGPSTTASTAAANPYAPSSQPANPYAPPPPSTGGGAYAPVGYQPPQPQPQYGERVNAYAPPASFVPTPPSIREQSPTFAPRHPAPPVAPPPHRTKPEVQWNDAPVLPPRKSTPMASAGPKPTAITSPFPNQMPPSQPAYGNFATGQQPPPPPPSRGSNRTPAPVAPPPPAGPRFQAPPPPPPAGFQNHQNHQQQQQQRFPPAPMPPPGQQPRGPPQPGQPYPPHMNPNFRGAPTPPPGYGGRPPAPPGPYGPSQGGQASQQRQNGPPQPPYANTPTPPSGPYAPPAPPAGQGAGPYGPPAGARPGPPPSFNGHPPRAQPSPAPVPAPAPPKPEPPKSKYPAGDRSHIPDGSKIIFNVLSNEIRRLRQVTPPQQAKMINDTEKRLNHLFDALNCGTLPEPAHGRVLEICKAIEARNQHAALDLHLQMLTQGAGDVSSFQAAIKLVIQRMAV